MLSAMNTNINQNKMTNFKSKVCIEDFTNYEKIEDILGEKGSANLQKAINVLERNGNNDTVRIGIARDYFQKGLESKKNDELQLSVEKNIGNKKYQADNGIMYWGGIPTDISKETVLNLYDQTSKNLKPVQKSKFDKYR